MKYLLLLLFSSSLFGQELHRDKHNWLEESLNIPTLIGGTPVDPSVYPATIRIRSGNSSCTAAVVGQRVVLSAAHCMGNGSTITFSAGGQNYSARCTHHQSYRGNSTADWALCYTNKVVDNIVYENLASDIVPNGSKVRLSGYGCIRPGGGGGNDGILRIGESTVVQVPRGTNYDTVTRQGSALCFGDSGGPAFIYDGDARYLFGVNSRGDIRTTSYLSSVFVSTFKSFGMSWANNFNDAQICGLHANALGCREGGDINPPDPEPPVNCWQVYEEFAFCIGTNGIKSCIDRAAKLKACVE